MIKPLFNWLPLDIIINTSQLSTQYDRAPESTITKKTYRSFFPALDIKRRNEPVATYTFYCDTSAIDDGSKCA